MHKHNQKSAQPLTIRYAQVVTLALLLSLLFIGGCSSIRSRLPAAISRQTPTPTATATPQPSPTPVAAVRSGESSSSAGSPQIPTPQVIIPQGFTKLTDATRGYSLALPRGWTELDLRSGQVASVANMIGQSEMVEQLQAFLATKEGQSIGIMAATDLTSVMFGGFPTLLYVSVVGSPNTSASEIVDMVQGILKTNAQRLGDIEVQQMETTVINNLPAVSGRATVDLSRVGVDVQLATQIVALLANDTVYVLTLATPADKMSDNTAVFEQIIGTFRPE